MRVPSHFRILVLFSIVALATTSTPIDIGSAQTSPGTIDYVVERVEISPANLTPGAGVAFNTTVRNLGPSRGTHRTRAELQIDQGADGTFDFTSRALGIISALPVNTTMGTGWSNYTSNPSMAWTPVAGTHKAKVCIHVPSPDPEDYRADANSANDCKTVTFTVQSSESTTPPPTTPPPTTPTSPDFQLLDLRYFQDTTGYAFTVVVKNLGATAGNDWASVRLDIDGLRGVMSYGIKPLSTGATDTAVWSSSVLPPRVSWSQTPGTHRATACIDNENGIPADSNSENNCKDITFQVTASAGNTPDFEMHDVRYFQDATGYAFTVVVKNTGASANGQARARLDIDGNRGVMYYGIKQLATGGTDTAIWSSSVLSPQVPWSQTPGTHRATACVDNENGNPADSNNLNDCKTVNFIVTAAEPPPTPPTPPPPPTDTTPPDYSIYAINVSPSEEPGKINAWGIVLNRGTSTSTPSFAGLEYRRVGASVWLKIPSTRSVRGLAFEEEQEVNWINFASETGLPFPAGIYEFRVCADTTQVIRESSETNNCFPPMRAIVEGPVVSSSSSSAPSSSSSSSSSYRAQPPVDSPRSSSSSRSSAASSSSRSANTNPNAGCLSSPELQRRAAEFCRRKCDPVTGKCGVNTFNVGQSCQGQGLFSSATWICYSGDVGKYGATGPVPGNGRRNKESAASSRAKRKGSSSSRSRSSSSNSSPVDTGRSPNLIIQSFRITPASFVTGTTWGVNATVANTGGSDSTEALVTLEINPLEESGQNFVSDVERVVSPLRPGSRFSVMLSSADPQTGFTWTGVAGRYRVKLCVNNDHRAFEWNYNDNCASGIILVRNPGDPPPFTAQPPVDSPRSSSSSSRSVNSSGRPNYNVSPITLSPSVITANGAMIVTVTIKNYGGRPTDSTSATLQIDEFNNSGTTYWNETRVVPITPLAPGGQITASWNTADLTLHWAPTPGTHRLLVCANPFGTTFSESDTTDNCAEKIFTVTGSASSSVSSRR